MCVCVRSEEHTSELQSHLNLVCRLLLEKKKVYFCSSRRDVARARDLHCRHITLCVCALLSQCDCNSDSLSGSFYLLLSFFLIDRAPPEINPLPLSDALPI